MDREEFERRKWGGIDQTYTCILIIFLNREKIWIGHRKGIWKQISTKKIASYIHLITCSFIYNII